MCNTMSASAPPPRSLSCDRLPWTICKLEPPHWLTAGCQIILQYDVQNFGNASIIVGLDTMKQNEAVPPVYLSAHNIVQHASWHAKQDPNTLSGHEHLLRFELYRGFAKN